MEDSETQHGGGSPSFKYLMNGDDRAEVLGDTHDDQIHGGQARGGRLEPWGWRDSGRESRHWSERVKKTTSGGSICTTVLEPDASESGEALGIGDSRASIAVIDACWSGEGLGGGKCGAKRSMMGDGST
jgi:hypothetical protein